MKQVIHTKVLGFVALSLTGIMLTSGAILSNITVDKASAAASTTERVAITVSSSCSLSAAINTEHSANLINGIYSGTSGYYPDGIGKSTITAICNNPSGFAIYAVGYSGTPETYGNTSLIGTDTGIIIPTGTATSGDRSEWAMKIGKVTDSSAYQPENLTIENGFDNYHAVPNDYTKVASFSSTTDATIGSKITTTYAAYISVAQAADTYIGEVKYTLVHPHSASSPSVLDEYNISYLQDFSRLSQTELEELKSKMLIDRIITLTDSRDGKAYNIAKLGDDNIWLLDNLALDLTDRTIANNLSSANTNATDTSLNYLRNGGAASSSPYANTGLSYSDWTENSSNNAPLLNISRKDMTNQNDSLSDEAKTWKYGIYYNYCAASAGSYCYNNNTGPDDLVEDICPKGWRIPTGGVTSGEYYSLISGGYGYDTTGTFRTALHIPLSGYYQNGTYLAGTSFWWSSSLHGNGYVYRLQAGSSSVTSTNNGYRSHGYPIRCILDTAHGQTIENVEYMQEVTSELANNTAVNTTVTLKDNRDNTSYTVAKLADGNLWLLDNLALDLTSSTVVNKLSSANTNASDASLTYLRNGGGTSSDQYATAALTLTNWTTGNSYTAPLVNTSYKNTTYTEDTFENASTWKYGVYYNFCAASAGSYCYSTAVATPANSTEDICPKGWKIPDMGNPGYNNLYAGSGGYSTYTTFRTALKLPLSGTINNGSLSVQETEGGWWTSSKNENNNDGMSKPRMTSNGITTSGSSLYRALRNYGYPIRCIFIP